MALTLNQIIARIRTLALSHYQINDFYFGQVPNFEQDNDINYPACFLEQLPGSIDRIEKLQTFNFRVYLLDRVFQSEDAKGNEQEVLSDMSSVAADLVAMLMAYEYEEDWMIEETNTVTPITEYLNDMVAGVYVDIGVKVDYLADRCQVPASDVTFETDFDMARTKILTYTGTGSEGSSFTVSGLDGKIVLAAYRAGDYKRIITTVPTDSDKLRVVGTDLGSYKGIQSTTGAVALQDNDALLNGEVLDFIIWD